MAASRARASAVSSRAAGEDTTAACLLDAVGNVAVAPHPETRKRERRPAEIATETLASEVVVRVEVHARVEIGALVRHRVGHARRRRWSAARIVLL